MLVLSFRYYRSSLEGIIKSMHMVLVKIFTGMMTVI